MRTVTGVELGPESCVLARVRPTGDRLQLSAVRGLNDGDWDSQRPLTQNLAEARRAGRFPRTARVVAWGLHESASATDPLTRTIVSPLREAGFEVDTVMSPAQALALLARRRTRPAGRAGAVWLALNRQGAAIAIVDGGELLYSREFDWHYRPAASVKEELLQRYSLVAHLAPEVRHGLDIVGAKRDLTASVVVTCGDLPDLRSLTMPLIEELDIEVETLDVLEGMELTDAANRDELAERVSALCLAAAVAGGDPAARRPAVTRRRLAAAAAVVALTAGGWLAARNLGPRSTGAVASAPMLEPAAPSQPPGPAARQVPPPPEQPPQAAVAAPVPARSDTVAPALSDASTPAATSGRQEVPPPGKPQAANEGRGSRRVAVPPREVAAPSTAPGPTPRPQPEAARRPLRAPLPQVNSILVAPDRRLAVVSGEIVREGDAIGQRILIRIEPDALILREPSGHQIRVPIRRKLS